MRIVVERTGLTSHLIRAWERRYGAVVPHRTETNRRLYSDGDIQRLNLLRRVVEGGNAISRVALLSNQDLESMIPSSPSTGVALSTPAAGARSAEEYLELALEASSSLDAAELEEVLSRAEMDLGRYVLIERVITGLLLKTGKLWRTGEIRPSQEHLTSAVVRQLLGRGMAARTDEAAPAIVLATPAGHLHELGCLMTLNVALMMGWRPVYLGADLPAEEIARAAGQTGARVVGLSLVYSAAHSQTLAELERLSRLLDPGITLLVGGRSASRYPLGDLPNTLVLSSLEDLQLALERLG